MEPKRFKRTKEDFTCEQCNTQVYGNGYTNHCPVCLWSKHVDITPGDRSATCGGLMRPVEVRMEHDEYIILHRCVSCGHERPNKTAYDDDFDALLHIARTRTES